MSCNCKDTPKFLYIMDFMLKCGIVEYSGEYSQELVSIENLESIDLYSTHEIRFMYSRSNIVSRWIFDTSEDRNKVFQELIDFLKELGFIY